MRETECPGLPAGWLNGWLAAIGLLVLEPRLRLSWTVEPNPIAVLTVDDGSDPIILAANAWPARDRIEAMPVAGHLEGLPDMERTIPVEVFRRRAEHARGHVDAWTLSSTVTDLLVDTGAEHTVRHAPLDPKGPGTIKWLHHRLMKSHSIAVELPDAVTRSLKGYGKRVVNNGLGFDATRISGLADSTVNLVDPVIEVLAFFGLQLLPMRGQGAEAGKSGTRHPLAARQRCWGIDRSQNSRVQQMTWPAWRQPLNLPGVDALLDCWTDLHEFRPRDRRVSPLALYRLGIHAAWQTRSYLPRGSSDVTVGFTSARMEIDAIRR